MSEFVGFTPEMEPVAPRPIDGIADAIEVIERLYMPGESLFGVTGLRMRQLGWTVFPQERGDKRLPAKIDGRVLKWKSFSEVAPSIEDTQRWSNQAASANTAIVLGPTSGNTFCLDIDITDRQLSGQVEELADEMFGRTVFRRVGNDPKIALIYRVDDPQDLPSNRSFTLMEADGTTRSKHMIEILSKGKPITSHGHHHTTGRYFQWLDMKPTLQGPEYARTVTPTQLDTFLERVEQIRKFHRNGWQNVEFAGDASGLERPVLSRAGDAPWVENADGIVVDGRDPFLYHLARETCRANAGRCGSAEGREAIKGLVLESFQRNAEMSGRWTEGFLQSQISEKVNRVASEVAAGNIKPARPKPVGLLRRKDLIIPGDDTFCHLAPVRQKHGVEFRPEGDVSAAAIEAVRLRTDRTDIGGQIEARVHGGLEAFFAQVYSGRSSSTVHVLKAPTGAGKTSRAIQYISEDPRTYQLTKPILFLLPTYANIEEVRERAQALKLDPTLSDEDLAEEAAELGLVPDDDIEAHVAKLREHASGSKLKTMIYRGKIAAGCQMAEKVRMLMDAGIGTANLCHARTKTEAGETEDEYCVHYETCPAIKQRREIAQHHVVFLPRSFLTLTVPEELDPAAVIADESVFGLLVHHKEMPLAVLEAGRKEPALTKAEQKAGLDADVLLQHRDEAVSVVKEAFDQGICPASLLRSHVFTTPKSAVPGLELVRSAKRVCRCGITSSAGIYPDSSIADIAEAIAKPQGQDLKTEYRFWSILEERIEALVQDELGASRDDYVPLARGDHDYRIKCQKVEGQPPSISVSWRSEPNWAGVPLLLLDASADDEICRQVFSGRKMVIHDVPSDFNLRTMAIIDRMLSVRTIAPGKDATSEQKLAAARTIDRIRRAISLICAMHGNGRVLIGMPKKVRKAVCLAWAKPTNADFLHAGAEAGLDFAKQHVAVVGIGRQELPTSVVDGLVAAITFDRPLPEVPIDEFGTGLDGEGKDLELNYVERTLKMRGGRTGTYETQEHAGEFARRVQSQAREEKIMQLIGRLRTIFRTDTPAAYIFGQAIPENLVIDEICTWDDLLDGGYGGSEFWDAVRLTEGVIDADLLWKVAPDLLNREQYQGRIDNLPARVTRNSSRIHRDGQPDILVMGHVDKFGRHAKTVFERHGLQFSYTSWQACELRTVPAGVRPDDKIEAVIGTPEWRRDYELSKREDLIQLVQRRGKWMVDDRKRGKEQPYLAGSGEFDRVAMPIGAWLALTSLGDEWLYDDEQIAREQAALAAATSADARLVA